MCFDRAGVATGRTCCVAAALAALKALHFAVKVAQSSVGLTEAAFSTTRSGFPGAAASRSTSTLSALTCESHSAWSGCSGSFWSLCFRSVKFFSFDACGASFKVLLNLVTHFRSPQAIFPARASTQSMLIPTGIIFCCWKKRTIPSDRTCSDKRAMLGVTLRTAKIPCASMFRLNKIL